MFLAQKRPTSPGDIAGGCRARFQFRNLALCLDYHTLTRRMHVSTLNVIAEITIQPRSYGPERWTFTHDGAPYMALYGLTDTQFGPEMEVEIYEMIPHPNPQYDGELMMGGIVARRCEPASVETIVGWWKMSHSDLQAEAEQRAADETAAYLA